MVWENYFLLSPAKRKCKIFSYLQNHILIYFVKINKNKIQQIINVFNYEWRDSYFCLYMFSTFFI